MQEEAGKKTLLETKQFMATYKAPLAVVAIIASAILLDYAFRSSDKDFYSKGLSAMSASKWDEAVSDFSRALRQNPADPAARFGLGWAYHSKGWLDEAIKQYETSAKAGFDTAASSYFNLGVIYQQKRQLDNAVNAYQKALLVNPNSTGATYNLGFVYLDKGMNEPALQQFKKTVQQDPRNVNAIYYAGLASERLGRKDDAKKFYHSALAIDPGFHWAIERLKALGG